MLTYPCSSLCLSANSPWNKSIVTGSALHHWLKVAANFWPALCWVVLSLRWPLCFRSVSLPPPPCAPFHLQKHFSLTIRLAKLTGEISALIFHFIVRHFSGYECTQTGMATADCLIFHRTLPNLLLHNST